MSDAEDQESQKGVQDGDQPRLLEDYGVRFALQTTIDRGAAEADG